jgi:hypothetical protein
MSVMLAHHHRAKLSRHKWRIAKRRQRDCESSQRSIGHRNGSRLIGCDEHAVVRRVAVERLVLREANLDGDTLATIMVHAEVVSDVG